MGGNAQADTREACIDSAQQVYDRLMLRTPQMQVMPFETLALLAKKDDGTIDKDKAKELIRLFRPNRDGTLGKLEWVKSVDVIYKELRLLSANITNSSQMDAAVENLVNVVFYVILGAIIIYRLGENPLELFLSFSSVLLAFAFMFVSFYFSFCFVQSAPNLLLIKCALAQGKSSSKYFDGCLFILVQRPYGKHSAALKPLLSLCSFPIPKPFISHMTSGVGDRMHLSNPQNETSPDGSSGWIVEKVTLFTTSVYWGATNERATISNGALSRFRVINSARSPNAQIYVNLKFAVDTPYEKLETFRAAVEQFLKDRPREWLSFNGFRPTEVATDRGYINYMTIAQHRSSWQEIGAILGSKADLVKFCMEVAKQLDMRYISPPLPVDLTIQGSRGAPGELSPQNIGNLAES